MNITSAWWHVDDQVIEFAPVNIANKLADGAAHHRPTPDTACFSSISKPMLIIFDAKFFNRKNQSFTIVFHQWPFATYAKHDMLARPINIGIHQSNFCTTFR
jgi:hypothetical protein